MKTIIAAMLLLPLLAGCLTQADQSTEADQIVKQVHQALRDHHWDTLMPLYDKKFFQNRSKMQWQEKLQHMVDTLGTLKKVQPTFQQKDPRFGGDFYLFGSLLKFEHGTVSETLTIYQGIDADRMTITGHLLKHHKRNKGAS